MFNVKSNKVTYMKSINSNQPCYSPSLFRVFAVQSLVDTDGQTEANTQNAKADQSICLAHIRP